MLQSVWPEPQRNHRGWRLWGHFPSMKRYNVEVKPLTMSYITQTLLAWHQQLVLARLSSTFHLQLKPWSHISSVRNLVSYKKLNVDNLSPTKITSWEIKSTLPQLLRCETKHSLKKYFDQLYKIRYSNTKVIVAACRLVWKWFTIYKATPNDE